MPGFEARAAFTVNSATVFKEDVEIVPTIFDETLLYIPWGGNNQLPFNIINLIEKDETLSTCLVFNAEVCFGSGLHYDTCLASQTVRDEIEDFMLDNDLASYFLGVSQDFKLFGFAVSVIILNSKVKLHSQEIMLAEVGCLWQLKTHIVIFLIWKIRNKIFCNFVPMNVQGFISAMSAYASWKASHPNASKAQLDEVYNIAQSHSFINWIYQNPNGSLVHYINLIHKQQVYYNSPQYQFDMLENQIEIQTEKIEDLQNEIDELMTELSYLQEENEDLSLYNTIWFSFSITFLIIIIFLIVIICKRTNILKQILDKFKKV